MKTYKLIILIIFLILMPIEILFSETMGDKKQYFAMVYTTGENWDTTKAPHEQIYFKEHSAYMKQLRETGIITLGGRFSDKGLMIIECADETEALKIISEDVSVQNKTFKAEVFPFSLFYDGCLKK